MELVLGSMLELLNKQALALHSILVLVQDNILVLVQDNILVLVLDSKPALVLDSKPVLVLGSKLVLVHRQLPRLSWHGDDDQLLRQVQTAMQLPTQLLLGAQTSWSILPIERNYLLGEPANIRLVFAQ